MRLIHDHYKDLYNHFEEHEIAPALYATPWFLTLFASQFTLGFVARVFGEVYLFFTMCGLCRLYGLSLMKYTCSLPCMPSVGFVASVQ